MAQLAASIVSHDGEFKREISRLLRAGGVPVGIVECLDAAPDLYVVDIRHDASSGLATIERLRAGHDGVPIFAIAAAAIAKIGTPSCPARSRSMVARPEEASCRMSTT